MNRRDFLKTATGLLAGRTAVSTLPLAARSLGDAQRFALDIGMVSVELTPGLVVQTWGYNGIAPGPLLRVREGQPVEITVHNASDHPELVHWHGLRNTPMNDGAAEEGGALIAPGQSKVYRFVPGPSGTRWYHTHTMAMDDLRRATYSGQYGFFYIEPRRDQGAYDSEVFLAAHHWGAKLNVRAASKHDVACEWVEYDHASFNDKLLSASEPIRVREGERILFHFLNASATRDVQLALPGHRFKVVALDGNPVPVPNEVQVLTLAVAERVDALVEMRNPGRWVLGSTNPAERGRGLGMIIEYANRTGTPEWHQPASSDWSYRLFARPGETTLPVDETFTMLFEQTRDTGDVGGVPRWTINGRSFPATERPLLKAGGRYRLRLINASGCPHPIHLHRHSFELTRVGQAPVSGIIKDTVSLPRYDAIDVDFVADDPGLTLFHCHQQLHMDYGFMQLFDYET
ncbi:MAG: multicopper oxidase family protein [Acidobacteriaceae bacterium]